MNDVEQMAIGLINNDYTSITFDTHLYELFCKNEKLVKAYIKVGRKFWHYDSEKMCWRKLTVTYIRLGIMFFTFDDEPDVEHAWFIGSVHCLCLRAAEIYPYEIGEILHERYPDNDFVEICKQCKWDDANGEITVEVIWD